VVKPNQNRFAALLDHEGHAVVIAPVAAAAPSWADMAKKPAVLVPKAEEPSPLTTLKFHTVYYDPKDTKYEPLMTDAEREAYRILEERKAAGCFEKRRSWLDLSDDEEEEEEEEDENW
jgi:hypothetical protein